MNTPNNKRKRESIERIEKVFIDLLQSKELNQISVSDICKKAGLNRTTFYANYADIYALADSIRDKLESSLSELYQSEITQGYNSNDYLRLFRHIKENQIFYKTYFKLGYDDQYKIISYDINLARQHFQNLFIEYHMEFFKGGITKIIKMWLQNGCRESPEEMFEIIRSEYRERT
ncbi:TetR/AcrR family transcriptional regulator [Ruminococcus sp. OA3]|uniref:TetR/AcrR family transcriptional regulator n=1 Tax=Ruminococcus sp. OA3 TaxID=2914164 RepID=UPI001F06FF27|nr:TetR/AcrR family transcriptional regulator [Ruminococcus sp. OA3]